MSWADQGIESELLAFLGKPHLLYLEKRICFLRNGPCSANFSIRTGQSSNDETFLGKPHLLYLEKRICFLRNGPCSAKFSIRTGQSLIGRCGVANGIPGNVYWGLAWNPFRESSVLYPCNLGLNLLYRGLIE